MFIPTSNFSFRTETSLIHVIRNESLKKGTDLTKRETAQKPIRHFETGDLDSPIYFQAIFKLSFFYITHKNNFLRTYLSFELCDSYLTYIFKHSTFKLFLFPFDFTYFYFCIGTQVPILNTTFLHKHFSIIILYYTSTVRVINLLDKKILIFLFLIIIRYSFLLRQSTYLIIECNY